MDFTALGYSEVAEPGPCAVNDSFLKHLYDPFAMFGTSVDENLAISPHLLNHNMLGTIDHFSHTEQKRLSKGRFDSFREVSIPEEQPIEEILWPQQQSDGSQQGQVPKLLRHNSLLKDLGRIEESGESSYVPAEASSNTPQPTVPSSPTKRKRGRPRLQRSPSGAKGSDVYSDPISDLRRSQLEKNRIAAEKCRGLKKKSTTKLLANASVLSSKNEALKAEVAVCREQLLSLKNEVLRHAKCGSFIIDGYIAKSASNQLIVEVESNPTPSRRHSVQRSSSSRVDNTPKRTVLEEEYDYNIFQLLNDDADAGKL